MALGYLSQLFPSLTATFVYREVQALRAAGLPVQTFSTWKPKLSEISDEAKGLVGETFYIFPLSWPRFGLTHARYLLTRPRRYLGTLAYYLSREHKTAKNRLRTLLHFGQAVYLAGEVERRGLSHLHVHFALNAATLAMMIARLTGITFSFTAHANDIFANPILLPEKIREARFIVAISDYNIRFMHNLVPGPATLAKMHLVHCGIDVDHFAPPRARPGAQLPSGTNRPPVILAVGRLVEKKGYPSLIKACRRLADQGYDFRCQIVGGGPQEGLLRQMIAEADLAGCVELVGVVFQERLKEYLANSDIFVLPCVAGRDGDMDGIPNTLMEAMAMEIPAISTTLSGIPELIEDGVSGLLVPPEDDAALARAIACLLDDPALKARLARAGRVKVIEEFEIGQNSGRLLEIFAAHLETAADRPGPYSKGESRCPTSLC